MTKGDEALLAAVRAGDVAAVRHALDEGASAGSRARWTPLIAAMTDGHVEVARLLIERGALDVPTQVAPMIVAAEHGHRELVELIIDRLGGWSGVSKERQSALERAAWSGHRDVVELLLDRGVTVEVSRARRVEDDYSTIRRAGDAGHLEVVELLAARGQGDAATSGIVCGVAGASDDPVRLARAIALAPDLTIPGLHGRLALHSAAGRGHLESVRLLLDHGADPSVVDASDRTPHRIALDEGHHEVAALLEARGARLELVELVELAATGADADVLAMLARPVNVNVEDDDGRRPLHAAAEHGRAAIVEALLARGAELDAEDHTGWTALMDAADMGHRAVVSLLIDRGADASVADRQGFTAETLADDAGRVDVVAYFLAGQPPLALQRAIERDDASEVTHVAEAHGVDLILANGKAPLGYAVSEGKTSAARALLDAGARPTEGGLESLLAEAYRHRHRAVTQLLLERGADVTGKDGTWLLGRAAQEDDTELIDELFARGVLVDGGEYYSAQHLAAWIAEGRAVRLVDPQAALDWAISYRDLSVLDVALAHGAAVEVAGKEGADPPILAAAKARAWPIVERLLAAGANPERERSGAGVAQHVAIGGELELLAKVAAAGGRLDNCVGALIAAKKMPADVDACARLIDLCLAHGDSIDPPPAAPATPLLIALDEPREELAMLLLERGANPNVRSQEGFTPLMLAAAQCSLAMVRALVERGAKLDAVNDDQETAAHRAARAGAEDIVAFLLERGASPRGCLNEAARSGKRALVERMLDVCELEEPDTDEWTPAMRAAGTGSVELLELFLARGADVERCGIAAARKGQLATLVLALDRGAPVDAKLKSGWTALIATDQVRCVELLLARGANVDAQDESGWTALMWAANDRNVRVAELLLAAGADRTIVDRKGKRAADHGLRELLEAR